MSVVEEIIKTVHLLRRTPQIDIERLSYTLDEMEWREFAKQLDSVQYLPRKHSIWEVHQVIFYGITVRRSQSSDGDAGRIPLRIEVQTVVRLSKTS